MTCPASLPTDPRTRRTRKLLQDAFRSLLRERRFSAISVQTIAEQATINRATFYAHYAGKAELAADVLKADLHTALIERFADRPPLSHESLTAFAVGVFEFMGSMHSVCPENAAEIQDSVGTTLQQGIQEFLTVWLSRSRECRHLFPGGTKEAVVTVISWGIYGGARDWVAAGQRTPAAALCREIISILLPL